MPDPEEPMSRTLPTRRLASFLARATEISRTASGWPKTRRARAAAILTGGGTAGAAPGAVATEGLYPRRRGGVTRARPACYRALRVWR